MLTTLVLPETPRYLAWVGKNEQAWEVIKRIHHYNDDLQDTSARAEFVQIVAQVDFDKTQRSGYIDIFRKPSWRKRAFLAIFLL